MAVKQKVVQIDAAPAEKSIKSLRSELKDLKDQLVNLEQGTEEYNEVLTKAANIQHELIELNQELAASSMNFSQVLSNVTTTVGGAVAGFQALTASMTLLGVENEDALQAIKKLQALMALTQGIKGIADGIKSFKRLVTAIENSTVVTKLFTNAQKEAARAEQLEAQMMSVLDGTYKAETASTVTATVATHAFKKALIATGIGAVVVAIGMLIAHLEDLARWLGFGKSSTEEMEKANLKLKQSYEWLNGTLEQYKTYLEGMQFMHDQRLKALDLEVEKMKAAGASEEEINKKRKANLEIMKQLAQEEVDLLDKEQAKIEQEYLKLMKSISGSTYSTALTMQSAFNQLSDAQMQVIRNQQVLDSLNADKKASETEKKKYEAYVEQAKQRVQLLNTYINTQKQELAITNKIDEEEVKIAQDRKKRNKERVDNNKKLYEELRKFDAQLSVDLKQNKDKELEQVKKAEADRIVQLKKFREEGVITEKQYQERLTQIHKVYNKQRQDIEFKYIEQEYKKRVEALQKNFEIERKELDRQRTEKRMLLEQEHAENESALLKREISIVDYYNKEKEIVQKAYEDERSLVVAEYQKESKVLEEQLDEKQRLLAATGINEETKQKLQQEINSLTQDLLVLDTNYNATLQQMSLETAAAITDLNMETVQAQMDALRDLTSEVVASMDAITGTADGLSSNWATAFDTMSNGLINLGQKIKEGGAQWQDYAQLAVAAFSAAGSIMSALADEQDTETKEGFEQQKKYQIAAATMNMLGGLVSAWVSAMNPANAWMTVWGQIAMGAAMSAMILTTGLMQIQKIKQQQFNGGGSTGASSSAGGTLVAPVQYTQDVQGASIEGAIQDQRVWVAESDITDTQNKVDVAENEARY